MKKNDFSEAASNLLIFGSVSLALAPFVLGDRLILIVTGLMKEGGVMIDQVSNYVSWLISYPRPIGLRLGYNIALRVVDRHVTKRRDLVLHLLPITDHHDRR